MRSVIIDGVRYVPEDSLEHPALRECIRELVSIQYFSSETHKHRAYAWDALNAISPAMAELCTEDPQAAWAAVNDLPTSLPEMSPAKHESPNHPRDGWWYVEVGGEDSCKFLHADGSISHSLVNTKSYELDGWFATQELAQQAIDRYVLANTPPNAR